MSFYFSGFNGFGQFEGCTELETHKPTEFTLPADCDAYLSSPLISCTWSYNAIASGNRLWLCGAIKGDPDHGTVCLPPFGSPVVRLATNDRVSLALLDDGTVHKVCIRTGAVVELKFIETEAPAAVGEVAAAPLQRRRKRIFPTDDDDDRDPDPVASNRAAAELVTDIVCCSTFSVALTTCNALYCIPSLVHRFGRHERIVRMCAGAEHCLLLTSNGDVYVFGSSLRGQLGQGETNTEETPVLLEALAGIKIVDIAAGAWHSAAVSAFGDLYTWGWNLNGQTGRRVYESTKSDIVDLHRRKLPTVFATADVIDLAKCTEADDGATGDVGLENLYELERVWCGSRHTIVRTRCGRWLACGWNRYGQLATATSTAEDKASRGEWQSEENVCFVDRFVEIETIPDGVEEIVCGSWCTIFYGKEVLRQ